MDRLRQPLACEFSSWLVICEKGHSDISVNCRLGLACAVRAG